MYIPTVYINVLYTCLPIEMVQYSDKKMFIKLKSIRKLYSHLPHTVNELKKDGGSLIITMVTITMTQSLSVKKMNLIEMTMY